MKKRKPPQGFCYSAFKYQISLLCDYSDWKRAIRFQCRWTENLILSERISHLLWNFLRREWSHLDNSSIRNRPFFHIHRQLRLVHLLSYTVSQSCRSDSGCIQAQVKATCFKFTASVRPEEIKVTLNVTWSSLLDRRLWVRNCWSNAIFSHGNLQGLQNSGRERQYLLVGGFSGWKNEKCANVEEHRKMTKFFTGNQKKKNLTNIFDTKQ